MGLMDRDLLYLDVGKCLYMPVSQASSYYNSPYHIDEHRHRFLNRFEHCNNDLMDSQVPTY